MNELQPEALAVGRVVRPHGVRGELVVEVLTDSPELRFVPGSVLGLKHRSGQGKKSAQSLTVTAARQHAGRLLVRAEGVDGRDAAEELRGALLTVSADQAESPEDPDEFHDTELIGLRAVLVSGSEVGVVRDVLHSPAGELLSIAVEDPDAEKGEREALVPFVAAIVPEVDVDAGKVVLDPPEGLLE
ncbi:ribosome maturation factor RimM [Saccharopolyspora rhizosphaerae]|uniref:Ribosome maturation factor RimM n=1 Tax=Saccharopolyspora rhizosphaerae TaxID=2492662 RepID=A0A3R8QNF8_9PSEU|nr:ribosome maturation factor RimM [Saccharopolyspora rhizosphaerae]RRO16220.1 ribosome maturation factor RimM [Saccharopolyspora rhizosphaerae]